MPASPPGVDTNTDAPDVVLPDEGPGRAAGLGIRTGAFVIDAILANLLAALVDHGFHASGLHNLLIYLAFLVIEVVFLPLAAQTPGMRLTGIAVLPVSGEGRPAIQWVLLRTVLLAIVVPAIIVDSSGRALHDRAAGTMTVHLR